MADKLRAVKYIQTTDLIGQTIIVYLKDDKQKNGIDFYVEAAGENYISGYDRERLNIRFETSDIEQILGPFNMGLERRKENDKLQRRFRQRLNRK